MTHTQQQVCRALAALGGVADAATVDVWLRGTSGLTVAAPDLRRETRDLVDHGVVALVGGVDVGDTLPANVYALTPVGVAIAAGLPPDPGVNELAQDRSARRSRAR